MVEVGPQELAMDEGEVRAVLERAGVRFVIDSTRGRLHAARDGEPAELDTPLAKGYPWPNAGVPNLGRIKQAFFDAFHGTPQKTFEQGLKMKLDEIGWQVGVLSGARGSYFGEESIRPTDEGTQAAIYAALLKQVACDPSVDSVLFFGFQDEPDLDRWQSGLMRADGSKRASYDAVKATLAQTGGRCAGRGRHRDLSRGRSAGHRRHGAGHWAWRIRGSLEVCATAGAVRAAHRALPGYPMEASGHGHRAGCGTVIDLTSRLDEGPGAVRHQRISHGQDVCLGGGDAGL
jgi:hypothetical protein